METFLLECDRERRWGRLFIGVSRESASCVGGSGWSLRLYACVTAEAQTWIGGNSQFMLPAHCKIWPIDAAEKKEKEEKRQTMGYTDISAYV